METIENHPVKRIERAYEVVNELPGLALGKFDVLLTVDRDWNVTHRTRAARGEVGKASVRFETIWTKITPEMSSRMLSQVCVIRDLFLLNLKTMCEVIERDMAKDNAFGPGMVVFERHNGVWARPLVLEYDEPLTILYRDMYAARADIKDYPFLLLDSEVTLSAMPYEFQIDFVQNCWGRIEEGELVPQKRKEYEMAPPDYRGEVFVSCAHC